MKLRNSFLVASAVVLSSAFSLPAFAEDPAPFTLEGSAFMGTGCNSRNTSAIGVGGDGVAAISVLFSDMISQATAAGRGQPKTCGVRLRLNPNPGIQLALVDIKLSGNVDVFGRWSTDGRNTNTVRISRSYGFNGARRNAERSGGGGYDTDMFTTYITNSSSSYEIQEGTFGVITYSPCGRSIIATADLTVQASGPNNYGDIGALDANVNLQYLVRTRRCNVNDPEDTQVITIPPDERATVRNACILRGLQGGSRITSNSREVCFDSFGDRL
jgi:hypothetical protein